MDDKGDVERANMTPRRRAVRRVSRFMGLPLDRSSADPTNEVTLEDKKHDEDREDR